MLAMIVIGAFSVISFYFATSFWMWFPLRAILHIALTVLFILSEFWISTSAPPNKRGFVLGIYATVLSLGFAGGPWLFAQIGSQGFLPFGVTFALVIIAAIPVLAAWRESPNIRPRDTESPGFIRFIWLVPTATAAVLVFGAVETGGFALFPVYGARIGYSEADAALLLSMIGLGNVLLADPARHAQRPDQRPAPPAFGLRRRRIARHAADAAPVLRLACDGSIAVRLGRGRRGALYGRACASGFTPVGP